MRGRRHGTRVGVAGLLLQLALAVPGADPAAAQEGEQARDRSQESNELEGAEAAAARRPSRETARAGEEGAAIEVSYGLPKVGGSDWQALEALEPGEVLTFHDAAAVKLATELDLVFGDAVIEAENVAPDYPGVYALWLQKADDGWRLVFNEEADVWGTQRDPAADVASVPLRRERVGESVEVFAAEVELGSGSGELRFRWGEHLWRAPFEARPATD